MFIWRKLGRVFNPIGVTNRPWLKEFAQAPSTLIFDDFIRVYFSCRPNPDIQGQYTSYTGFLDLKRENLFKIIRISEKPILELGRAGTFDEFGIYPTSVIRYHGDVYAYYGGWTRCESVPFTVAIGIAVSKDNGESFTRLGPGPILSNWIDEPFIISGPKIRRFNGTWYLWYIAGRKWVFDFGKPEPVYKIRMAISNDGYTWKRVGRDIISSKIEENESQASPDVFFYCGKYHMFFCYRYSTDYRENKRGYRIGYASSDDLLNWIRDDSKVGIDISETGFDNESISYPHVFEIDGTIYLFYLGNQVGRFGFGLATLESRCYQ